jgi:Domain of unknown function (DUF4386)
LNTPPHSQHRTLAIALVFLTILGFATMALLGPAIGWPASLRLPPADQLIAISESPAAVALGYWVYLLYSVLIAPVCIALAWRVCADAQGRTGAAAQAVVAWVVLSSLARCIGILRWLTAMPVLATAHAQGDASTRSRIG